MAVRRLGLVVVLALVACLAAGSAIVLMRHPSNDLPAHRPAVDAAGAAGWVWPDGVPGWRPGQMIRGFPVSGVQPVEVAAAQLAAARAVLDAKKVRVLMSVRPNRRGGGVLAILAAPTLYQTPTRTCLAALLQGDAPVVWHCPGPHELSHSHVLVAAAMLKPSPRIRVGPGQHLFYLVGVARGDVDRVEETDDSGDTPANFPALLYERGATWGEFTFALGIRRTALLFVYGHGELLETVRIDLRPGQQRVFR